jgi:hypothetical protein
MELRFLCNLKNFNDFLNLITFFENDWFRYLTILIEMKKKEISMRFNFFINKLNKVKSSEKKMFQDGWREKASCLFGRLT